MVHIGRDWEKGWYWMKRLKHEVIGTLAVLVYLVGWIMILLVLANKSTPGVLALGMVFFGVNTVMLIRGR